MVTHRMGRNLLASKINDLEDDGKQQGYYAGLPLATQEPRRQCLVRGGRGRPDRFASPSSRDSKVRSGVARSALGLEPVDFDAGQSAGRARIALRAPVGARDVLVLVLWRFGAGPAPAVLPQRAPRR